MCPLLAVLIHMEDGQTSPEQFFRVGSHQGDCESSFLRASKKLSPSDSDSDTSKIALYLEDRSGELDETSLFTKICRTKTRYSAHIRYSSVPLLVVQKSPGFQGCLHGIAISL